MLRWVRLQWESFYLQKWEFPRATVDWGDQGMRDWRNISYYFQISPVTFVTEKCSSSVSTVRAHTHTAIVNAASHHGGGDWRNSDVPKYKIMRGPSISLTQQDRGECKQYLAISTDTSVSPQRWNVGGRHHALSLTEQPTISTCLVECRYSHYKEYSNMFNTLLTSWW